MKTKEDLIAELWGGVMDIAPDIEDYYENKYNKSCVYWTNVDNDNDRKVSLNDRPNEYITHGYTCDFDEWGVKKIEEAVDNNAMTYVDVIDFIKNNA